MYKDTGCKSASDCRLRCLESNLGSIVDSLISFEEYVDFTFDNENHSVLNYTLPLYINEAHECVATCQNLFDQLLKDFKEVTNET